MNLPEWFELVQYMLIDGYIKYEYVHVIPIQYYSMTLCILHITENCENTAHTFGCV